MSCCLWAANRIPYFAQQDFLPDYYSGRKQRELGSLTAQSEAQVTCAAPSSASQTRTNFSC